MTYSCAIYNEAWGWEACREDIDQLMKRILETTGATDYIAYISGGNNFRYRIYPEYKANRKEKPDPIYRAEANAYLVTEFGARVTDGYEADDGIAQSLHLNPDAIVCSIDKDLLQLVGQHYNWRKNVFTTISPIDGLHHFYRQLLTGDRTDNIISGLHRMGPVTAGKVIDDLVEERDMFDACRTLYNDDKRLLLNGNLLWLIRQEGITWENIVVDQKGFMNDIEN